MRTRYFVHHFSDFSWKFICTENWTSDTKNFFESFEAKKTTTPLFIFGIPTRFGIFVAQFPLVVITTYEQIHNLSTLKVLKKKKNWRHTFEREGCSHTIGHKIYEKAREHWCSKLKALYFYFNCFFVKYLLVPLRVCHWLIITDSYFSSIFPMLNSHKKNALFPKTVWQTRFCL